MSGDSLQAFRDLVGVGRARGWLSAPPPPQPLIVAESKADYHRQYHRLPRWRAYHTAYMRRWRAARRLEGAA